MKILDKFLQKWRIRKVITHITKPVSILDIGCFDTRLFESLGHNLKFGIGIDPLLTPMQMGKITLIKGYFPEDLPKQATHFDAITLLAVLEHIPYEKIDAFVLQLAQNLDVGGRLYITVPNPLVDYILVVLKFFRLIDGMSLEEHHGYDVRQTPQLLEKVGMRLVKHETFQLGLNNLFIFEKTV